MRTPFRSVASAWAMLIILGLQAVAPAVSVTPVAAAEDSCQFTLGFAGLRDLINQAEGADEVGPCWEQVHYNGVGNAFQTATGGSLYWRRDDNWTGFTDGYRTWIGSAYGLEVRLNTERYRWELSTRPVDDPERKQDLTQPFQEAVQDAAVAKPEKVSTSLTAIVESNDHLVWREQAGKKQVLGVTWTGYPGYNGKAATSMPLAVEVWISPVPEVKDFCQTQSFREPTLRLEQLLGLPVANGKQWFVEMWLNPHDLFRPSPDPEITDQTAELDFPTSRPVSDEYKAWFNDLQSKSYGQNGYPWTRLGYTYDWGNPPSHVGLSEFVVKKGSVIEVNSVTTTEDYCRR